MYRKGQQMTNFELIKQDEELLKDILSGKKRIAVVDGKLARCRRIACTECDFGMSLELCEKMRRRWLEQEVVGKKEMTNYEWLKQNGYLLKPFMTDEEVIKRLEEFKILHTDQAGWDVSTLQALDRAIEAFKKEPKMLSEIEHLHKYISKLESQIATGKVEIVTCKECIHRDEYGCRHGHPNCKDNFYCADAEIKEYEAKVITRGNCMMCGKELTEGLFFCKECGDKQVDKSEGK